MQTHLRQLPGLGDVTVTASDLSVVTRLLPTATASQWSLVNETCRIIPDAQVQLRERSLAWTRDPHAPRLRLVSALVTKKFGSVRLRRDSRFPRVLRMFRRERRRTHG